MINNDGIRRIAAERSRQVVEEGYTPQHDEGHAAELTAAAASYAAAAWHQIRLSNADITTPPSGWPWASEYWKPAEDPARNLEKAGALIAAALDALEASR